MDLKLVFLASLLFRICECAISSDFPIALPNCNKSCNGYGVPYPFGTGKGCYKNKWFEVFCNSPQLSFLFLPSIGLEVVSFSLGDYELFHNTRYYKSNRFQIQSPVKYLGCPDEVSDSPPLNLTGTPFFISDDNKFTSVGCNNKALMEGKGPQIVGCETTCGKERRTYKDADKSCVGYKCCQTKIPVGLQTFDATVAKLEHGKNGCQVAYLSRSDLSPDLSDYVFPSIMDLEWRLDDVTSMSSNHSSLCEVSTSVIRTDDKYKYQCSCRDGYEGNPYLPGGCQDIDECKYSYQNKCGKYKCVNVSGSYRCEKTWPAILGGTLSSGLLLLAVGTWWQCKVRRKQKQPNRRESSSNEMEVCC